MNKLSAVLFGTAALAVAPLALTGCEVEEQQEIEADGDVDYDTEIGLDEGEVQELEANADRAADEIGEGLNRAGETIENEAREAGDVIDSNVDLGDNAENQ